MQTTQTMRRPRRHRWLTVSVFFIAYSMLQSVFTASDASEPALGDTLDLSTEKFSSPAAPQTTVKEELEKETTNDGNEISSPKPTESSPEDEKEATTPSGELKETDKDKNEKKVAENKKLNRAVVPTIHAPRPNCIAPAIEQFPKPLMGQSARKHGGLIIHVLVAVFTFIGLAIVCDEYFVSSLDRICEELKLPPDVAGATFMAAGSSAPELATVVIGVFCAQDDIGVSGVIGSAVFNIMFVISVCALCAGTVSHLNWWPLCRDCFFYALSILVMLCTIGNGFVSWPEALFMLIMYGVYCVALRYNSELERWASRQRLPVRLPTRDEQAALVTYKSAVVPPANAAAAEGQYAQMEGQTNETRLQNAPYNPDGAYDNAAYNAEPAPVWDPNSTWDPNSAWSDSTAQRPAPAGCPRLHQLITRLRSTIQKPQLILSLSPKEQTSSS
ncbi:hypothetical protein ACJJTC_010941 [Scirpophaga incertulas]